MGKFGGQIDRIEYGVLFILPFIFFYFTFILILGLNL